MKNSACYLIILMICVCIISCNEQKSPTNANSGKTFKLEVKPPKGTTTKVVTFQRATVYTGSTDYYFQEKSGQEVKIRQSNFEENTFKMPANLLDNGDEIEGPPGANPEMVGQSFVLTYDKEGDLISVKKE